MASEATPLLPRQYGPSRNRITTTTSPLIWPSIALPAVTFLYTLSAAVVVQHLAEWPDLDWATQECVSRLRFLTIISALSCLINSARKLYAPPTESQILIIAVLLVYFTLDVCLALFSVATATRIYQEMDSRPDCPSDPGWDEECRSRVVDGLIQGGIAAGSLIAVLHLVFVIRGSILLTKRIILWWRTWRLPFTIQVTVKVSRREESPSEDTAP